MLDDMPRVSSQYDLVALYFDACDNGETTLRLQSFRLMTPAFKTYINSKHDSIAIHGEDYTCDNESCIVCAAV